MSRTIPSYTVEGLQRRLLDMERQLADLHRRGEWQFDRETPDATSGDATAAAQLLAMVVAGDSIGSGGDYVTFTSVVAHHGFSSFAGAGDSWTHPVSGVYVLTYEHEWDTYTGGGTVQLEIDGVVVPEGTIAEGTSGQQGRGVVAYVAEEGQVGKIKVTQSSGTAAACDALVRIAITDPKTSHSVTSDGSGVVSMGTQAAPVHGGWASNPAGWTDASAEWIWHTALVGDTRADFEEGWFELEFQTASALAGTIEFSADNESTVYLNGTSIGASTAFTTRVTASVTFSSGVNVIRIHGVNGGGGGANPAAVILSARSTASGVVLFRTTASGGWVGYTSEPYGWP